MDHSFEYPNEYIFNTNTFYYTRKGSAIFIFEIINPIGYKTGRGLFNHREVLGIGDSAVVFPEGKKGGDLRKICE